MSNNSGEKNKKGIAHYLHKQWIATKGGRDQHTAMCKAMREKPVLAKTKKGGKTCK